MIDMLSTCEESFDCLDKIFSNGTAHTSIRDLDDLLSRFFDKISIDACWAEFILDDGDLPTTCISDNMIEESGFPTSEESSKDSNRNKFLHTRNYLQWVQHLRYSTDSDLSVSGASGKWDSEIWAHFIQYESFTHASLWPWHRVNIRSSFTWISWRICSFRKASSIR